MTTAWPAAINRGARLPRAGAAAGGAVLAGGGLEKGQGPAAGAGRQQHGVTEGPRPRLGLGRTVRGGGRRRGRRAHVDPQPRQPQLPAQRAARDEVSRALGAWPGRGGVWGGRRPSDGPLERRPEAWGHGQAGPALTAPHGSPDLSWPVGL